MNDMQEIAYIEGLSYVQTTNESNGYPAFIRDAVIGFETFEEAEGIGDKYDLIPVYLKKKDGWDLYHRNGMAYEAITVDENAFGPNETLYYKQDAENFWETEVLELLRCCDSWCESWRDLDRFIEEKKELEEAILLMKPNEVVVATEGRYYRTCKQKTMCFYEDTWTTVIGLIKA